LLIRRSSWKVRFLIRAHKLLSYIHNTEGSSNRSNGKNKGSTEEIQIKRIETAVDSLILYLAKALLEPLIGMTWTRIMPGHRVGGSSNYYYVMMTIWYVWNYFKNKRENWASEWLHRLAECQLQKSRISTLLSPQRLPPDNWTFSTADRDKVHLLQ
jgi:hypothetical protein